MASTVSSGIKSSTACAVAVAASPIVVTGLTNGREYSCSVTARNAVGESASSLAVAATPYTTPPAPTLGGVTVGDGFIEVAFTAPAEDGGNKILDYELACTTEGDSKTVSAASSPLKLSGLRNGSPYACTVRARNAAGKGAAANLPTSTPRTMPSAPTVSGVTADVVSLVVAFTAPSSDGGAMITRYTARCIYNGISRFNQAAVSPIVVDGLPNGVAASCAVSATNVAGESAYSAAVLGTPRDFAADAQFTAALDSAGRRVTLTFRDVFPSGTQYRIESQAAGASFVSRAVIDGTGGAGASGPSGAKILTVGARRRRAKFNEHARDFSGAAAARDALERDMHHGGAQKIAAFRAVHACRAIKSSRTCAKSHRRFLRSLPGVEVWVNVSR